MTHFEIIADYMTKHGSITAMDGFKIGCTKVTTRIGEMRKAGYKIADEWEEATNRYGVKVRYKRYRLVNDNV